MAKSASRIGLFGGSFNPVHNGHMRLAEFALSEFNLDKVYFVPSCRTPLKDSFELFPSRLRLRCLRRAVAGRGQLAVSTEEVRRGGTSYTVDTLRNFRKRLGPKTVLYFLAGADTAKNLSRWKSPSKVLNSCRFTILSRPGEARTKMPPGVLWADFPALAVSSSDVRRRLRSGQSVRNLVPEGVDKILQDFNRKAGYRSISKRK